MRHDVQTAKRLGAAGLVFGLLRADGTIDRQRTAELVELARPSSVTFHKAFDQTREPEQALDVLIELGIDRVLTSGCRPTAAEGSTYSEPGRTGQGTDYHSSRWSALC